MFYHFISGGNLPWSGVKDSDRRMRYLKVFAIKDKIDMAYIAYGHPREFEIYTR